MARLFGTDGVRGIANVELTAETAYRLGQAAVVFLGKTIVVGKDTRLSGDMLESALICGIESAGGTALLAGVIPTPAVALLVRKLSAAGGAVISASHNPPEYNGIKLFDAYGYKLPDEVEDRIEEFISSGGLEGSGDPMPQGSDVGFAVPLNDANSIYVSHVVESVKGQDMDFKGMTVAIDAGHGASSVTTPQAFRELGAEVIVINDDYDGFDINVECGSTHLAPLRELLARTNADIGVAHDGDADRVIMMTPDGDEIDGDVIECVLALDMKARGKLTGDTVVTTVMSNLGFIHAMNDAGISVRQTKVGDRYVLEEMRSGGFMIGGEQSGHIILLEHNSTGDGLMTAVQFVAAMRRRGDDAASALNAMRRFPQSLINVAVGDKEAALSDESVVAVKGDVEARLGDCGRVLLRPSGTEPVVRVMVEAQDEALADECANRIADAIKARF